MPTNSNGQQPERRPVVLITGAAGSIGTALTRVFRPDYRVVGFDRTEAAEADDSFTFDLTSERSVTEALTAFRERHGARIDSVIHLAAYFDFTGEDHPLYEKVNVTGTRNLIRGLRSFDVGQFVYAGTMLVHAPCRPGERIDESAPIEPAWAYPKSKAAAEAVIRDEHGDMPVVRPRLAGLYDEGTAVPTLAHQIARIYERDPKSHVYTGDLSVGQSFLHKEDMVDAFRRIVDRRAELPGPVTDILIGEPDAMGYGDIQNALGRLLHDEPGWPTVTVPKPLAKAGAWAQEKLEPVIPDAIDQGEPPFERPFMIDMADDHYALDISRARALLGWEPRHRIADTLPDLVAALKADPAAWYAANGVTPPAWLQSASASGDDAEALRVRHERAFRTDHGRFLWAHFLSVGAGAWLMVSPFTLAYQSTAMVWSDVLAGIAVMALSLLSLSWQLAPVRWGTATVGIWLLLAPVLFAAPTAAAYLNGTLLGAIVVGLSILVRPTPGISPLARLTGPTVPPGWTASPSSWTQRLPVVALALVGLFVSRYLAAVQLGHVDSAWDPFFAGATAGASGTDDVIKSDLSESFPVSDAGLGGVVYMLEILIGLIGSTRRWREMPWMVALFGFLIVPLGIVSILFIVIQPIVIGNWCTLCLVAAAAMLLQIAYSSNEFVATGQFLLRRRRAGEPLLRVLFRGDTDEGDDDRARDDFVRAPAAIIRDIVGGGVTLPWNLLVCIAVGIWLMFTRATLGHDGALADAEHLVGSLAVTVSVIALAEVGRALRWLNVALAAVLVIAPLAFDAGFAGIAADMVAAGLLVGMSIRRGPVQGRYGTWDRFVV